MAEFPTTYEFQRANFRPLEKASRLFDPLSGRPARSHPELAIRATELFHAEQAGNDVETEFQDLISGWEAHR